MKVLQVNCVYKKGSTGKITFDLHNGLLERDVESVVCYGRGQKESDAYKTCTEVEANLTHILSKLTGVLYGGGLFSTGRLIRLIKKQKPDIVHLQCINGYFVNIYRLLSWLGKHRVPTVLTLHAEFMYTGSCGHALDCNAWKETKGCHDCPIWKQETGALFGDRTHRAWKKMKIAFEKMPKDSTRIVSVSPWLYERAKASTILKDFTHSVVLNGLNTQIFHTDMKRELIQKRNGEYAAFHATAFFSGEKEHFKGGYYILQLAEKMKKENVHFYVAGPYEDGLQVPNNVTLLGTITDQRELAKYYTQADVTLVTSKRETFSMVCAESLCCGTPVVGFRAGAPETISLPEYSTFVPYGDINGLEMAVQDTLQKAAPKEDFSKMAANIYDTAKMVDGYLKVYNDLLF